MCEKAKLMGSRFLCEYNHHAANASGLSDTIGFGKARLDITAHMPISLG